MLMHVIKPDGTHTTTECKKEPELYVLQELVGGHIELVIVKFNCKKCIMYVNEEGLLDNLPINDTATNIYRLDRDEDVTSMCGIRGVAVLFEKTRKKK